MTDVDAKKENSKYFLFNIRNLPSIPIVMLEVSKLLDNPMTSAAELGIIISKDQGLVAKILAVANSPLYGLPRRVSTIEFAIVILGFDHIKNIVVALSMIEAFKGKDDKNWDRKSFWLHSITVASAAKRIADELGYRKSGEAFTAGLLHDLGISVLQRYFNKEFNEICKLAEQEKIRYSEAETKIIGLTHAEVGQFLADKWNLPQSLGDAILFHHNPSQSVDNKVLTSIVHLADYMTQKLNAGNFRWDNEPELDQEIISILKMGDIDYLEKFILSYEDLFNSQINSINI